MSKLSITQEVNLRFIPRVPQDEEIAKTPGGMYASAKLGLNKPLETAAQVPGYFEYQTWRFVNGSEKDTHKILFVPKGEVLEGLGVGELGFRSDLQADAPVILGFPSDYKIEVRDEINDGTFIVIRPAELIVGVDRVVGVGPNRELQIQYFPIDGDVNRPGWFIPNWV